MVDDEAKLDEIRRRWAAVDLVLQGWVRRLAASVLLGLAASVACGPRPMSAETAPPPPVVEKPPVSPASAPQPYDVSECTLLSHNYGDWQPTVDQVARVGERLATGLCYNYWEIDPRKLAATVQKCAAEARSATVRFVLPLETSEGTGACDIELRSISWSGRMWLWVRSSYQRNGQFGTQIDAIELRGDGLSAYATAMMCIGDRTHALESSSPPVESGSASPEMVADWSRFPAEVRAFFCTAEPFGPDLSQAE